jgi:hypothetical protein
MTEKNELTSNPDAFNTINFFANENEIKEKKEAEEKLIAQKKARFHYLVKKFTPFLACGVILLVGIPYSISRYHQHVQEQERLEKIAYNNQMIAGVQSSRDNLGNQYEVFQNEMKLFGISSLSYYRDKSYDVTVNFNDNSSQHFIIPLDEEDLNLGYQDTKYTIELKMVSYTQGGTTHEALMATGIDDVNQFRGADVATSSQKLLPEINHMIERGVDAYIFNLQPQYAQASFNPKNLAGFKKNLPAWFNTQAHRLQDKMLTMAGQYAPYYKYDYQEDAQKLQSRQNYINTYNMLVNLGITPKDDALCQVMTMPLERGSDTDFLKIALKGKTTDMKCGNKSVIDYYLSGISHVSLNQNLDFSDSNGFYHDYNRSILYLSGSDADWKALKGKVSAINENEKVYQGNREISFDKGPLIQKIIDGANAKISRNSNEQTQL